MVAPNHLKKNYYRAKKSSIIVLLIVSSILLLWASISINLKRLAANEVEGLQKSFVSFSSFSQLADDGSIYISPLSPAEKISRISKNFLKAVYEELFISKDNELDKIKIFIKFKHLERIYNDRSIALKKGINENPKEVPCKISDGKNTYKCEARLKGDLPDHWSSKNRISLRIKIKDGFIHGLQEFAIQKPSARQFPYDQAFHDINYDMGRLSSNNQRFFDVTLNGESWGVMNAEPIVDSKFIEVRGFKRLGVFRISNQEIWKYQKYNNRYKNYFISDPSITLSIRGRESAVLENPIMHEIYSVIIDALHKRDGSIFDREIMVANLVLALSWGNLHTLDHSNAWYTWNQYTKRLEPILTDQSNWKSVVPLINNIGTEIPYSLPYEYTVLFLDNPLTDKELKSELIKLKSYFEENNPIVKINSIKKKFFKNDMTFNYSPVFENIDYLLKNFQMVTRKINQVSYIDLSDSDNQQNMSPEQFKLIDNLIKIFHFTNGKIRIFNLLDQELVINELSIGGKVYKINKFIPPSSKGNLRFVDLQTDFIGDYSYKISAKSSLGNFSRSSNNEISILDLDDNYNQILTTNLNTLCVPALDSEFCEIVGKHNVAGLIIINKPALVKEGSEIFFEKDSDLVFSSSANFIGSNERPIILRGDNSGGIFIKNAENQTSKIKNTIFGTLSTTSTFLNKFTGAVNGYGGRFELENVVIKDSISEDQLNIIDAQVDISNLQIINALSDAFDCDFCKGELRNIFFKNVGGDGLDISGSDLRVINLQADLINDKGVSVGERSTISLNNVIIENSATAIAVKDSSFASIENIRMKNIEFDGFMTYVKKPFFDEETSLQVSSYTFENEPKGLVCVREENTSLIINEALCDISQLNVDELYKGRMKKF